MAEPDDTADLGLLSPVWVGTRAEAATSDRAVLDAMVAFETALSRALAEHDLAPAGEVVAPGVDVRTLAREAVGPGNPTLPLVARLRATGGEAACTAAPPARTSSTPR